MSSAPQDTTAPQTLPRLLAALLRLAELQREPVDRLALQEAVQHVQANNQHHTPQAQIASLTHHLGLKAARWLKAADASQVPALVHDPIDGWGVLVGQNAQNQWVVMRWDEVQRAWSEGLHDDPVPLHIAKLRLSPPFVLGQSPVFALVRTEIAAQKGRLIEAAAGGLVIGILGLITSFYSMQIYDRVIPTGAMQTLLVLSLGALLAIGLDWMARSARTKLYEAIIDEVDQRMARTVYLRLLAVRLDQMPKSVGSLASQMRGYETVRSFLTQVTTSVLVDMPFAILFLIIMGLLGGTLVLVPLLFFVVALGVGLSMRQRMEQLAKQGAKAGNFKTGLLVETVEGAETLKSGQGGWRMLGRWLANVDEARDAELQSRNLSEHFQHLISSFQQMSYVLLVAFGAWLVTATAASVLYGGAGNDSFTIDSSSMITALQNPMGSGGNVDRLARIDGGSGMDSVEIFDITGSGNNILKLTAKDVLELGSANLFANTVRQQVLVKGNAGDTVDFAEPLSNTAWTKGSNIRLDDGIEYLTYNYSNTVTPALATVYVQNGMTVM